MCGRFSLSAKPDDIADLLPDLELPGELAPRYNIAPSQPVPTVLNDGKNKLTFTHWGLIPSWAKDPAIGSRLINARSETAAEKNSFKNSLKRRRCLILADGFYEWQKVPGAKQKKPMFFQLKSGKPFAFAGLWDEWCDVEGGVLTTSTILTISPNELIAPIHNRMPVILPPTAFDAWMTRGETAPDQVLPLLKPYPADDMKAVAVSTRVNNVQNDDASCIKPVQDAKPQDLF